MVWINMRVASPVIRFSSVKEIDEALDIMGKELTAEEEKYLEELCEARNVEGINEMRIFRLHQRATPAEAHTLHDAVTPLEPISAFTKPALSHSLNYPALNSIHRSSINSSESQAGVRGCHFQDLLDDLRHLPTIFVLNRGNDD